MLPRRAPLAMVVLALLVLLLASAPAWAGSITFVVHVSVDGLSSSAVTSPDPSALPNFYRLQTEGASTLNARTDVGYTGTLPNHVTQLTGRPVDGDDGHNWTDNTNPPWAFDTLHENKSALAGEASYVAGAFDVVHDAGGRTGAYVSKEKLSLFDTSWDDVNGAPDPLHGRDKIDVYEFESDTSLLVSFLVADMQVDPFDYAFLHLVDPDTVGHASGWGSPEYQAAVEGVDGELGALFDAIETDPALRDHTAIVLTADHGGKYGNHGNPAVPENYTIPFFVWGPGVAAGADLYGLNPGTRLDPGTGRPPYSDPIQPVRNGDAANLALDLLGLGPVPGSTINAGQDLNVRAVPEPGVTVFLGAGCGLLAWLEHRRLRSRDRAAQRSRSPSQRPS